MAIYHAPDPDTSFDTREADAQAEWQAPPYIMAMLHNVYLCREKMTPPLEHGGDFWHWRLTAYGLDLMCTLVRASVDGFTYAETFMEPEPEDHPQLAFMNQVNAAIRMLLMDDSARPDWAAVLDFSPYLRDQHITFDTADLWQKIDYLIVRIKRGDYDRIGSRIYRSCLVVPGANR
jgi:hypothetical protein